ncbi:MAG: flavin reductase family protein [Aeropyrum sp.]|nr:flavin reductase family protein [Aeropyrum sp.]
MAAAFKPLPPGWRFYYLLHPSITVVLGTLCPNGRPNFMPASWNVPVSEEPPTVAVAVDRESYTFECLEHLGEATINVPSHDQVDKVYALGTVSGRDVDKVKEFSIRLEESEKIKPPRWAETIGVIEGRVYQKVDVGEVRLYVFEALGVYAREGLYTKWGWDFRRTNVLLHGAGRTFFLVGRMLRARV